MTGIEILDELMGDPYNGGIVAIVFDVQGTAISTMNYINSGIVELLGHMVNIGLGNSLKSIYKIVKSYKNKELEKTLENIMEFFSYIDAKAVDKFGYTASKKIDIEFLDFLKSYPGRMRIPLSREVDILGNRILKRFKQEGVPCHGFFMNRAGVSENDELTGKLFPYASFSNGYNENGLIEQIYKEDMPEWHGKIQTGKDKLEAFKYLEKILDGRFVYITDKHSHEWPLLRYIEHTDHIYIPIKDLKKYMKTNANRSQNH